VPPEDELPGPLSDEAAGGQSLLLADVLLPLGLPVLGDADWLPGGQSAATLEPEAALLLGELLSEELVLGELVLGEVVLGELVSEELVLGELVLGELEYPLDCAIAPAENASSALAVAAASNLSFIWDSFQEHHWKCAVGSAQSR
jgi:hypothetical protein